MTLCQICGAPQLSTNCLLPICCFLRHFPISKSRILQPLTFCTWWYQKRTSTTIKRRTILVTTRTTTNVIVFPPHLCQRPQRRFSIGDFSILRSVEGTVKTVKTVKTVNCSLRSNCIAGEMWNAPCVVRCACWRHCATVHCSTVPLCNCALCACWRHGCKRRLWFKRVVSSHGALVTKGSRAFFIQDLFFTSSITLLS